MKLILTTLALLSAQLCLAKSPASFTKVDDLVFASPDGFDLRVDIYTPETGKASYPVIVIWHGGGWLINDEKPMDQLSEYLCQNGGYVVCNMNYRLLGDQNNTVTMNQIVEDVFGGLLWVKHHVSEYKGDPNRIGITGDSAGGHLSSMVLTHGRKLETDGFEGESLGFHPTWMPEGKTPEELAEEDALAVQAAVISYGAFDMEAVALGGFEKPHFFWQFGQAEPRGIFGNAYSVTEDPERYRAVAPIDAIPNAADYRLPPQFHHVGSLDQTTSEKSIRTYVEALESAGQEVSLKVFDGFNHAYMDGGCNEFLGSCFETHAIPALEFILPFFDSHLK